jgi:hypothetical protein
LTYEIIKGAGKTMWCVLDSDGDLMRFYSKRECEAWIARAERNAIKFAEDEAAIRVTRLEIARAYLARRALRPAAPVQLEMFA